MAASYLFYEMLTCTLHFLDDVNGETQLSPPLALTLTSYLLHYSHASFPERGVEGGGWGRKKRSPGDVATSNTLLQMRERIVTVTVHVMLGLTGLCYEVPIIF